jgi:hypothetical protein
MRSEYKDRWIECTSDVIKIHGYYFPWGTKHIRYSSIRAMKRVDIGAFTGKWRIWGTANPRYWASLDPGRPTKKVGFILDLGRLVRPFVTPDDPDAFEAAVRAQTTLGPDAEGGAGRIVI